MSFLRRFALLSLLILTVGTRGQAQVHEQAPLPGLDKGVLLTADVSIVGSTRLAGDVGTGDFSVVLNVELNALDDLALYRNEGWQLQLRRDGSLSFSATESANAQPTFVTTKPAALPAQARASIVVSVKRDARQPYTGIWVNGIELASGVMPPVRCSAANSQVRCDSGKLKSVSLKVYDRALLRTEVVDLAMAFPKVPAAKSGLPSPNPTRANSDPLFVPKEGETIALIGGTEAVALAESGELEQMLLAAFPQTHFHFRNLAWEGDTVFKQDRPMNFGSLAQQLRRVNVGTVLVMFGRQECLDRGKEGLADFKAAFSNLLASIGKVVPTTVVIGPWDFEHKAPPLPDLRGLNQVLDEGYLKAIEEACTVQHALFLNPADGIGSPREPVTRDGVTFTPYGLHFMAEGDALLLNINPDVFYDGHTGESRLSSTLGDAVKAKNRLWHDYWRPSNWAFLYGDRTNQPSSRDPVDAQIRFFPSEQEKYLPLIKEAEEKVYRTVEETAKKLP